MAEVEDIRVWLDAEQEYEDRALVKAWALASVRVVESTRVARVRAEEALREAQHRLVVAQEREAAALEIAVDYTTLAGLVL